MKPIRWLAMVMAPVLFGLLVLASPALAVFQIGLDADGLALTSPDLIITDNQAGDLNNELGVILVNQPFGGFELNINAGTTKPFLPNALDIAWAAVNTTGGAADLWIIGTETGFDVSGGGTLVSLIGLTNAGATLTAFQGVDTLNAPFGVLFFDGFVFNVQHGPFGTGGFTDTQSVGFPGATVSITDALHITCTGPCVSSGDILSGIIVPEPASLLLLGSGLVGLALYARRRVG